MLKELSLGMCRNEQGLANRRLQPLGHVTFPAHALKRANAGAADAANGCGSSRHEKRHIGSRIVHGGQPTVAALYVQPDGCYALPDIDVWDQARDARLYAGPHPVVAHPPCQRWGRFWHGSTRKPHQFKLGDDDGCFAAALAAVRDWGGVLEHPADSHAWSAFGLYKPTRGASWTPADKHGGLTCYVEQGHYGHFSRKPTWLYAIGVHCPELNWTRAAQRLHPVALERYGYEKARRIGMAAMIGGKDKTRIREATPIPFRDVLIGMAMSADRRIAA